MRTTMVALALVSLIVLSASTAGADWEPGDDYKMHYPQMPNRNGWDVRNEMGAMVFRAADDWQCSQTGPVSDFHLWYSWFAQEWNMLTDPVTGDPLDLALVITPEPATMGMPGLGGPALLHRHRR